MRQKAFLSFVYFFFFALPASQSQNVGINNPLPDASALLDLASNDKGILIPRMATTDRNAIVAPATGLMVYDNDLHKFYYFDGLAWIAVGSNVGWSLKGDAGTTPAINFIGTTDAQSLLIKVNNVKAGFIDDADGGFLGRNTFFGKSAGLNNTITGYDNTYIGTKAGLANTTGTLNTAVGAKALQNAVATFSNVAIGREAMQLCVNAVQNTAVGTGALQNITGGFWNNAFGYLAMRLAINPGISNNAFGTEALLNNSGSDNCAFGHTALKQNTTGYHNVAFGSLSLYSNVTGFGNTAIGTYALQNNSNGNYNTTLGFKTASDGSSNSHIVAIGDSALFYNKASGNVAVGSRAMKNNNGGVWNTALGYESMYTNTSGAANTALGYSTLAFNTTGTGNTAVGSFALENNTIGTSVTAVGYGALRYSTSNDNTALGAGALGANTIGKDNSAMGALTLSNNISGNYNIGIGNNSLLLSTTSSNNVAVGFNNLSLLTASGNVGNNTAIGNYAGDNYAAYSSCTFVGYQADANATGYTNSTAIGNGAQTTASHQVKLGNATITAIGGAVNWSIISDGRFKTNIQQNIPGLNFINQLKPVSYNYDIIAYNNYTQSKSNFKNYDTEAVLQKEKITYSGFIAQDVEQAANNVGYSFSGVHKPENDKDTYTLSYAEFVVPLVKAVQELYMENQQLKKTLEDILSKMDMHDDLNTSKK